MTKKPALKSPLVLNRETLKHLQTRTGIRTGASGNGGLTVGCPTGACNASVAVSCGINCFGSQGCAATNGCLHNGGLTA